MEVKKPSLTAKTVTTTATEKQRLSPEMISALNGQVSIEFNTVSLFQSMWACTESRGFMNAAKFFAQKVKEEQGHVNRVYAYMLDKGIRPVTPAIPQPTQEYTDLYEIIETCRTYQVGVTTSYEKIGTLAQSTSDHTTYNFIQFFLDDQIQEENTFITLCDQYKILSQGGMTGIAWMELDKLFKKFID